MSKSKQKDPIDLIDTLWGFSGIILIITLLLVLPLLALWTDSNLDWLITQIKGQVVNVPYWLSLLTTIFLNGIAIFFNIIISLIRLIY